MSYCREYGKMVTVPDCLGCKNCRPPGERVGGQMCEQEDMDEDGF